MSCASIDIEQCLTFTQNKEVSQLKKKGSELGIRVSVPSWNKISQCRAMPKMLHGAKITNT